MKPPKDRYLIFIRPVGSLMWTQHIKSSGVPYVGFSEEQAYHDACRIAEKERVCTHVSKVELRIETDDRLRATVEGIDTTYFLAPKTENQTN